MDDRRLESEIKEGEIIDESEGQRPDPVPLLPQLSNDVWRKEKAGQEAGDYAQPAPNHVYKKSFGPSFLALAKRVGLRRYSIPPEWAVVLIVACRARGTAPD